MEDEHVTDESNIEEFEGGRVLEIQSQIVSEVGFNINGRYYIFIHQVVLGLFWSLSQVTTRLTHTIYNTRLARKL